MKAIHRSTYVILRLYTYKVTFCDTLFSYQSCAILYPECMELKVVCLIFDCLYPHEKFFCYLAAERRIENGSDFSYHQFTGYPIISPEVCCVRKAS
jgi:hypothetical protein